MKNNQGFTLIELMIVVAIMGILIMIAIPPYQDYIAKVRFQEMIGLLTDSKTVLIDEYVTQGRCTNRGSDTNEISSPYVSYITSKGVARKEGELSGSVVNIGNKKYPVVCTLAVNLSQKGQEYFKRGNKKATVFFLNLGIAEGSYVWGCAASTNFSRSVTPLDCQVPAW